MYVQFQIPARTPAPGWPVIMVHGSTHTGAALESTPDGREGWYPYFVRKGVATYVVDQSGRGRSGFDQSVLHEAEARLTAGDRDAAAALLPTLQTHHRQRRVDGLVRPPRCRPARTSTNGHADPARLTRGSARHGTAEEPHVAPLFPLAAVAEYYKQLVPNAEVTLPGSTCATLHAASALAGQHLDAAEPGAARRAARRRDRRHALAVRASWAITWCAS